MQVIRNVFYILFQIIYLLFISLPMAIVVLIILETYEFSKLIKQKLYDKVSNSYKRKSNRTDR